MQKCPQFDYSHQHPVTNFATPASCSTLHLLSERKHAHSDKRRYVVDQSITCQARIGGRLLKGLGDVNRHAGGTILFRAALTLRGKEQNSQFVHVLNEILCMFTIEDGQQLDAQGSYVFTTHRAARVVGSLERLEESYYCTLQGLAWK